MSPSMLAAAPFCALPYVVPAPSILFNTHAAPPDQAWAMSQVRYFREVWSDPPDSSRRKPGGTTLYSVRNSSPPNLPVPASIFTGHEGDGVRGF